MSWRSRPKSELLRFAIGADGVVRPDAAGRLGGRGLWLECRRSAIEAARAKGLFARLGRRAAAVPADLADRAEAEIERLVFETVGLAVRAGRVEAQAPAGGAGVLVRALPPGPRLARAAGRSGIESLWIEDGALARRLLCLTGRLAAMRADAPTPGKGN